MSVYTVHEPPPRKNEDTASPDRFAFVRDGFYFWAFLLGPLWLLWRRLWMVLLLYVVAAAAVQTGLWALGMSAGAQFTVGTLIALLVGFEAASLQRWTLARRGWDNVGVVVAPDLESAERRFFDSWAAGQSSAPRTAPPPPPSTRVPPSAPDVIGLFPEPEPRPRS